MDRKFIIEEFKKVGITAGGGQADLFLSYMDFLLQENEKYNLTAITKPNEIVLKHFVDSCLASPDIKANSHIIDIGAGAGFPSIPLAILRQDCRFVLVDSLKKRTDFLENLIEKLNLKNCSVVWSRSEDLALNGDYREVFDYCVARAVAQLNTLSEYCLPFVKVGGSMLAYKSKGVDEEIQQAKNAIKILGGSLQGIKRLNLENMERNIVNIQKISPTPKKYPRKQNKPKTSPL